MKKRSSGGRPDTGPRTARERQPETTEAAIARGLSHEILSPAAAIQAAVEVMAETESLSPQGLEIATEIRGQLEQIVRVVHQWLDFVSPLNVQSEKVPVEAIAEAAKGADSSGHFETGISHSRSVCVVADPGLLQRTVAEIVSNAAAFGATRIDTRVDRKGSNVSVQIRNNGSLLDSETAARAFEPFFSTRRGRAGLGLPLARKWMTAMNGSIEVLRERNGFELVLPPAGD